MQNSVIFMNKNLPSILLFLSFLLSASLSAGDDIAKNPLLPSAKSWNCPQLLRDRFSIDNFGPYLSSNPHETAEDSGEIVGQYEGSALWSGMKDVAIKGEFAYCIMDYGMTILDIRNPSSPDLVSSVKLPSGEVWAIEVSGDYAYIAAGANGIQVVNISNPKQPLLENSLDTQGYSIDIKIEKGLAFIADGYNGLQIIDLHANTYLGDYNTPDAALALAISGSYCFLACGQEGLQIVNTSNPAEPVFIYGLDNLGKVLDIDIQGEFAYLAVGEADIKIVGISNPEEPELVGSCLTPAGANCIEVAGGYAYVTFSSPYGLQAIDISDPYSPLPAGLYNIPGVSLGLAIEENSVYVANWLSGLEILDISNPQELIQSGRYATIGALRALAINGNYAYVAGIDRKTQDGILQILDITDKKYPGVLGSLAVEALISGITVSNEYAYLAMPDIGLGIVNIASPNQPYPINIYNTTGNALGLAIEGHCAYVAADTEGLLVIDISNPANPFLFGSLALNGSCVGIKIKGGYAYILDLENGISIVDISNPQRPLLAGSYVIPGKWRDLAIEGDYIYLCDELSGLHVFNIAVPDNIIYISQLAIDGNTVNIAIADNYVYLTDIHYGLKIIDITDPKNPYPAGHYYTHGYAWDVAINESHAYIADYFGFLVLSLKRPEITVQPDHLYFESYQDYKPPPDMTINIDNTGAGNLHWIISNSTEWLVPSPASGTAPSEINVMAITDGLKAGIYYDTLIIAAKAVNSPRAIPVQLYLKPPNHPPVLAEIGPQSVDENSQLIFNIHASDADGTLPTLSAENIPKNGEFTDNGDGSGLFRFAPDYTQSGDYSITFYSHDALDSDLADSEIVMIVVNNVNRNPMFLTAFEDTQIVEDDFYELTVQVCDPDNDPVKLSCHSMPEGASFHDSLNGFGHFVFSSSYIDVDMDYSLKFMAEDSACASAQDSMILSVQNRQLEVIGVQSSTPQTGINDILISDSIQVIFNEDIAAESLDNNLSISSAKGEILEYKYNQELHSIFIRGVDDFLLPLDTITIHISSDTKDLAGYSLGADIIKVLYTGTAVYPGDADNDGIVDERDILPLGFYWHLTGPERGQVADFTWKINPAHMWSPISATYADIDGSGTIDGMDICGIAENWGSRHETIYFAKNVRSKQAYEDIGQDIILELYNCLDNCPNSEGKILLGDALESLINISADNLPKFAKLHQNYPNPFNPSTRIEFYLPHSQYARLSVYNIRGQKVVTLIEDFIDQGYTYILWDGKDQNGRPVASGIYLYRLESDRLTITKSMILLK